MSNKEKIDIEYVQRFVLPLAGIDRGVCMDIAIYHEDGAVNVGIVCEPRYEHGVRNALESAGLSDVDSVTDDIGQAKVYGTFTIARWVMSPCPSYFDSHEDTAFGAYPVLDDGEELDPLFVCEDEWSCYKAFVCAFGDDCPVLKSADYKYL